jgi:hypothetical protein
MHTGNIQCELSRIDRCSSRLSAFPGWFFVAAYLLSLLVVLFTASCENQTLHAATTNAILATQHGEHEFVPTFQDELTTTANSETSNTAFVEGQSPLAEVLFTLGEKYDGSYLELVNFQVIEHKTDVPAFGHASSAKLPNQPTLVVLKVILQV